VTERDLFRSPRVRVLLCDAYRLFAEAFASVLEARGDHVVAICDDPSLLAATVEWADPVAICVVDFGAEPCRLVRPAKLLALTAEEDASRLHAILAAGVDGLMSKRRGLEEIIAAMDKIVGGTSYFDPVLIRHAVTPKTWPEETAERRRYRRLTGELTPRELEVLHQLVHGVSTGGMAVAMGISVTTVRTHTQAVLQKLGVNSRLQAAACAISIGLIEPPTA
jgi:two-component system, NarL family, nitrate/nitrite response regulator NarL